MTTRVLIVDDSATVRIQVRRAMSAAGFTVHEALDGVDALAKIAAEPEIALVICDVNMPNMDGLQFLEVAQKTLPHCPDVVMLTTEGHPELMRRARSAGAKGWVVKPFDLDLLVESARRLTSKKVA